MQRSSDGRDAPCSMLEALSRSGATVPDDSTTRASCAALDKNRYRV
jgi:hypothetical protein